MKRTEGERQEPQAPSKPLTMDEERERQIRRLDEDCSERTLAAGLDFALAEVDALRAALAAAEAKLADCRASVKVCDVCGEETSTWEGHALKAALADERRHADALLNALHNPDNITVERAIEAHHARRAAEVANG